LDCLGARPFRIENPCFWLLDSLGFPWILSSETRLINGLRGNIEKSFFSTLPPHAARGARSGLRPKPCDSAGSFMGQAYLDFVFSAMNCRATDSPSGAAQARRSPIRRSEVGRDVTDRLDRGARGSPSPMAKADPAGITDALTLSTFPTMARWNHCSPPWFLGRLPAGGTCDRSPFSQFPSPLSRVAGRRL
jgi:hypothetical protein